MAVRAEALRGRRATRCAARLSRSSTSVVARGTTSHLWESFGPRAIGVDPSETMLAAALGRGRGRRGGPVEAVGEALPL